MIETYINYKRLIVIGVTIVLLIATLFFIEDPMSKDAQCKRKFGSMWMFKDSEHGGYCYNLTGEAATL